MVTMEDSVTNRQSPTEAGKGPGAVGSNNTSPLGAEQRGLWVSPHKSERVTYFPTGPSSLLPASPAVTPGVYFCELQPGSG